MSFQDIQDNLIGLRLILVANESGMFTACMHALCVVCFSLHENTKWILTFLKK